MDGKQLSICDVNTHLYLYSSAVQFTTIRYYENKYRFKAFLMKKKFIMTCKNTDLVAFAEAWHEFMVQLIKMTQVTSTIKWPASRSERARLSLDHL